MLSVPAELGGAPRTREGVETDEIIRQVFNRRLPDASRIRTAGTLTQSGSSAAYIHLFRLSEFRGRLITFIPSATSDYFLFRIPGRFEAVASLPTSGQPYHTPAFGFPVRSGGDPVAMRIDALDEQYTGLIVATSALTNVRYYPEDLPRGG